MQGCAGFILLSESEYPGCEDEQEVSIGRYLKYDV